MKVLIVDDEQIICDGLRAMIPWEEYGFQQPDTASNGAKALEKMAQSHYDILITDVRMPTMDGLTLCQNVHNRYPDCVIIILSGYGDFQYAQKAIEFGVRRYLLKPVDENKLKEVLVQIQHRNGKHQADRSADADRRFYECALPFACGTGDGMLSVTEAGKTMARSLAKGDMQSVRELVRNFIWKLFTMKPPYDVRVERCETFLAPTMKMARNLKLQENAGLDEGQGGMQFYHARTLTELYEKIIDLVDHMDRCIQARMSAGSIRASDQMAAYIQENYHTKLSTASLAEHFHLSAAYCGRLFKEEQGISIIQYIHQVRIEQAKRLLAEHDYKLEYIALQVGYPEVSSFYSQFKRLVDMTPEQYRRLSGKDKKGAEQS